MLGLRSSSVVRHLALVTCLSWAVTVSVCAQPILTAFQMTPPSGTATNAPIITSPSPSAPFHSNASTFVIAGVAPEMGSADSAQPRNVFFIDAAASFRRQGRREAFERIHERTTP